MKAATIAEERRSGQVVRKWTLDRRSGELDEEPAAHRHHRGAITWLKGVAADAFLPQGFPSSVTEDYRGGPDYKITVLLQSVTALAECARGASQTFRCGTLSRPSVATCGASCAPRRCSQASVLGRR